jgi:predicted Zn-dependent protease
VDPAGMVHLLNLLEREAQDMPEGVSFLSSHPLTKNRIAQAEARVAMLGTPAVRPQELDSLFSRLR